MMSNEHELEKDCRAVLAWAVAQNVAVGTTIELKLPPDLAHLSEAGVVQAAGLSVGHCCVLMKKSIGWKDNFAGILCCEASLNPGQIVSPPTRVSYISLPGFGIFEELYISKRYSSKLFEVYFDLN